MYADRHARRVRLDPGSLGLSAAMVGLMMAGLVFSVPDIVKKLKPDLTIVNIKEKPIPPEEIKLPDPKPETQKIEKIYTPPTEITISRTPEISFASRPDIPATPLSEGTGTALTVDPPKPPSVIVGPGTISRLNYQPEYPSDERRLGREGRVVVRVLIGTDGRVKQVEKVSAASDSFFEATRKRALEKWRLTPGTRDGVPIEAWRTMSVSFVMNEE